MPLAAKLLRVLRALRLSLSRLALASSGVALGLLNFLALLTAYSNWPRATRGQFSASPVGIAFHRSASASLLAGYPRATKYGGRRVLVARERGPDNRAPARPVHTIQWSVGARSE
jgi:hypothetical protein